MFPPLLVIKRMKKKKTFVIFPVMSKDDEN